VTFIRERTPRRTLGLNDTHFLSPSGVQGRRTTTRRVGPRRLTLWRCETRFLRDRAEEIAHVTWSAPTFARANVNNTACCARIPARRVKTVYTHIAGPCLVASATRGDVSSSPSGSTPRTLRRLYAAAHSASPPRIVSLANGRPRALARQLRVDRRSLHRAAGRRDADRQSERHVPARGRSRRCRGGWLGTRSCAASRKVFTALTSPSRSTLCRGRTPE